jgi:hypothetical protein
VDFVLVGIALLGIAALMVVPLAVAWGARRVLAMVDGGGGGSASAGSLEAARERAMQLQMTGEGQSAAWAENAQSAAYDAGYYGREFDASWGIEASAHYEQARQDRADDNERGWN